MKYHIVRKCWRQQFGLFMILKTSVKQHVYVKFMSDLFTLKDLKVGVVVISRPNPLFHVQKKLHRNRFNGIFLYV